MKLSQKVTLASFHGAKFGPSDVEPGEDFWKLVGQTGIVVSTDEPKSLRALPGSPRVLVRFDCNLDGLGLINHNELPNSLWISLFDLQIIPKS